MEKLKRKHLSDLHFEHILWKMEGDFYRDELTIYQRWLEQIAMKNTGEDVMKEVEHFQNQFIIHNSQQEQLIQEVKAHEQWLADFALANPVAIDRRLFADHDSLRDDVETFKKLYLDLKTDFRRFLEERL